MFSSLLSLIQIYVFPALFSKWWKGFLMKICTNPLSAILALSKLNITEVKTLNPKTVGRFPREKLTSHNFKVIFAGDTESVRAVRHPEAGQEGGPGRLLPVRV